MTVTIHEGDCLEVLPRLAAEGVLVDAIVTDPPYHLIQASRGGSTRQNDPTKPFGRAEAKGGFMGQKWDGGDVAFRPETWAAMLPVLKTGGFLLAFGGTRRAHRLFCAIEDAGFVIQDTIAWIYGSGFPKGRAQLKPAHEPICVAYKPGGKRGLCIDECRIATNGEKFGNADEYAARSRQKREGWIRPHHGGIDDRTRAQAAIEKAETLGRWPANLVHDGSDEVMTAFAAFGEKTSGKPIGIRSAVHHFGSSETGTPLTGYGDAGSVARFYYTAKADRDERAASKHPTVKPLELMRWFVRLVTPPGGTVLDPFAGSGSTGEAAAYEGRSAVLIEREREYCEDIRRRVEMVRLKPPKGVKSRETTFAKPSVNLLGDAL